MCADVTLSTRSQVCVYLKRSGSESGDVRVARSSVLLAPHVHGWLVPIAPLEHLVLGHDILGS